MWPPPKIADPSPPPKPKAVAAEAAKPKPEDYYKSTLNNALATTAGLGTVLGKVFLENWLYKYFKVIQ
jgi:hypothetical protein